MGTGNEPLVLIQQIFLSEPEASQTITCIVQALAIVNFRGAVQFRVYQDKNAISSSVVTFTNDLPNGEWNVVRA
jgi:hypothetical protein